MSAVQPTNPVPEPVAVPPKAALGVRRRTGRGHVDSYGEGRVCAVLDCTTKLSRYNGTSICSKHDEARSDGYADWSGARGRDSTGGRRG